MKRFFAAIACLGLTGIPAVGTAASLMTYGGVEITPGLDADARLQAVQDKCHWEATVPPRGSGDPASFRYRAALRACLYRNGFFVDPPMAYPVPLFGARRSTP